MRLYSCLSTEFGIGIESPHSQGSYTILSCLSPNPHTDKHATTPSPSPSSALLWLSCSTRMVSSFSSQVNWELSLVDYPIFILPMALIEIHPWLDIRITLWTCFQNQNQCLGPTWVKRVISEGENKTFVLIKSPYVMIVISQAGEPLIFFSFQGMTYLSRRRVSVQLDSTSWAPALS